jgi:hypothetical protein
MIEVKNETRNCPQCGKIIFYKSNRGFILATRNNTWCGSCWCIEREKNRDKFMYKSPEYRKKMSDSLKKVRNDPNRYGDNFKGKCRTNALKDWNNSESRKKRISIMKSDEYRNKHRENSLKMWENPDHISHMKMVHESDDYRRKRRIITRNLLKQKLGNGRIAAYSKKACYFVDELNKKFGWNLVHAENGGEYEIDGYSLDGYDTNKNIIFEYDEPHHYNFDGSLKKKDIQRQNDLIKSLNPIEFWRYDEKRNLMYNTLNEKELCQ